VVGCRGMEFAWMDRIGSRGFVWVLGAISLNTVVELYPFPRCVLGGDGYVSVTLVKHCLGFVVQFLDRLVSVCLMFYCL